MVIASNPLELKMRNGLKLQKKSKKCLKPGFKNLTIAANFARAYIAELSPRALSYRFSFYIGRIYSVWFGRCGQTNQREKNKLEIIVVDAPRKMIDMLKSFWKIHGLLLLCVVRDSKRSFDYKGAQWRGKNEAKKRNPVSRASFVINTVSRYEFCLNPAPADDLNPAVPQNSCAFPVIPRFFLG